MKKKFTGILLVIVSVTFLASGGLATKPGEDVNSNGFPSGAHFNLNLIAKKAEFTCPDQEYLVDEYGNYVLDDNGNLIPVYGNVVFIPEDPEYEIKLLMESGKKGPKSAPQVTELQATDWCTGFGPNDPATIRLPKNDAGYDVYARALATPTDNPDMTITPGLVAVEDEAGNDLLYLGLVTSNGFSTPYITLQRKRGKSTAVEFTGLFEWSGSVCYLTDGYCDVDVECWNTDLCCVDEDGDGIYASCLPKADVQDEYGLCPEGNDEVMAYCRSYENEWIFNIGDFVTYLWDIDNNGLKLLQVRFYPRSG